MAATTMTMPGSTSRFAQNRGGLAAPSRRSSRTSVCQVRSTPSRRSSTASLANPEGTQAPSKYLLNDQDVYAASKEKHSFWSRSSSKDAEHDSQAGLLVKRVTRLKASLATIRSDYGTWQAQAVVDKEDTLTQKIDKLAMRFDASKVASLSKQALNENGDTAKLAAQWCVGRKNPQTQTWYGKMSRVQQDYAVLQTDIGIFLKEMQTYAAERLVQQVELEKQQRIEHIRKTMPRPAFYETYRDRHGKKVGHRQIHEQLYEQLARDDKRIYAKGGLFYLYASPTADPAVNKLESNERWHVRLVFPGTTRQLSRGDWTLDLLRNGEWCVAYVERYDHKDPGWLAEIYPLSSLIWENVTPKPPRCGPYTDEARYRRRMSATWDEPPPEWYDDEENQEELAPAYTPEYIEGPYKNCVKRIERARCRKLGRPCHVADLVQPFVQQEKARQMEERRKAAVKRIERARLAKLGRPCHIADLVEPASQKAQYDMMEYYRDEQKRQLEHYERKAARRRQRDQASLNRVIR